MAQFPAEDFTLTHVGHLPIVKHYAKKLNLVDTVNTMVESQMELSPGIAVLAMVLDTLSGRTPLYRLKDFYQDKDTELLFGVEVDPACFSDHNMGRVLDKLYEVGTQKIFSEITKNAIDLFEIDTSHAHFDTTSVSVYGDYDVTDPPFAITHGYSKDKRPDLKQFLISMLCVDRNIPVRGAPKDGNASDKTVNNDLMTHISKHMARHHLEPGAFVYVADSAFVTGKNLDKAVETNTKFISRLPATYTECGRAIQEAARAGLWNDIGVISDSAPTPKRPPACYQTYETTVTIDGRDYRAIVVHSSAHDKRRHKRIDRLLAEKRKELEAVCKKTASSSYFCEPDARAAADKLAASASGSYHRLDIEVKENPRYGRGRPAADKPRVAKGYEYSLDIKISEDQAAVAPLRLEAGCFVLISNLCQQAEREQWSGQQLLRLYKNQDGIEKNFGFLKDPVIVNSLFLKNPQRIEVLGLIFLTALLIWRLMERSMRRNIESTGKTIPGWEDKPTKKPTAFMMTTKFANVSVVKIGNKRQTAYPLRSVHLEYLKALNVDPSIYTNP
jgi:transposase